MGTKICNDCGEEKPLSDFYPRKSTKSRVHPYCKSCHNERSRRYKATHSRTPRELAGNRKRVDKHQLESQGTAGRKGQLWTSTELDTLMREDLSSDEVARLLGRTYRSVLTMRAKAKKTSDIAEWKR